MTALVVADIYIVRKICYPRWGVLCFIGRTNL